MGCQQNDEIYKIFGSRRDAKNVYYQIREKRVFSKRKSEPTFFGVVLLGKIRVVIHRATSLYAATGDITIIIIIVVAVAVVGIGVITVCTGR